MAKPTFESIERDLVRKNELRQTGKLLGWKVELLKDG
jgi:hypothetical protein